jgi:protocatechuate 3,4-dioxygenase, beta subunit
MRTGPYKLVAHSGKLFPTLPDQLPQRRQLLSMGIGLGIVSLLGPARWASAEPLDATSEQVLGPMYPMEHLDDIDADLTRVKGKPGLAAGQILYVGGRVLNANGEPVAGARIELWQTNAAGRYRNQAAELPAALLAQLPAGTPLRALPPLDPNFQGYAIIKTDVAGRYRFKTVKPSAYGLADSLLRAPHIHFDVRGRKNRLVTTMYFDGEPLNDKDAVFTGTAAAKRSCIATLGPVDGNAEPGAIAAKWDIVLLQG